MRRTVAFLVCGLALVAVEARNIKADRSPQQNQAPAPARTGAAPAPAQPASAPAVDANAVVQKYCATCHSERVKSGGLVLQDLDPAKTAGTPPCGACRQLLWEFAPDAEVLLANLKGDVVKWTVRQLIPGAFDAKQLT